MMQVHYSSRGKCYGCGKTKPLSLMEYKPGVERWVCSDCKIGEPKPSTLTRVIYNDDRKTDDSH